jgi:hypothetical protein
MIAGTLIVLDSSREDDAIWSKLLNMRGSNWVFFCESFWQWLVCESRVKWRMATLPQEHQVMGLIEKKWSHLSRQSWLKSWSSRFIDIRLDLKHVLKSSYFYLSCDSKWKFSCRWILQNALNGNLWNVWTRSQTTHLSTPSSRSLHICTMIIVLPNLVRCIVSRVSSCFVSHLL